MMIDFGPHCCVVGMFWGDEGKGKIVDLLTGSFDAVVRYCGGSNAGHSVVVDGRRFAMHLLPSGVLHEGVAGVVANGVVVDPKVLLEELDNLADQGIRIGPEALKISTKAHVVFPYHRKQDRLSEAALADGKKIGTTARGIGPCYADKANRSTAFRMGELGDEEAFCRRLEQVIALKNTVFQALWDDDEPLSADDVFQEYRGYHERLRPYLCDTTRYLLQLAAADKRILFEGAHGALLDVDHGTYPFVTSSSCSANGVASGAGVPASMVSSVIGITKAYTTRVGAGPFPTELDNEIGQYIREAGHEYGTTTGRPRRCGWFDAVAGQYTAALAGVTHVALMHLDTLRGLDEVKICSGYRHNGRVLDFFPDDPTVLADVECVLETLPGWQEDLRPCRRFSDLPDNARHYVLRLESLLGVPIAIVSVGPGREDTAFRDDI